MEHIDLTGKKFGRLTAIEPIGKTKSGQIKWRCLCDCGKETIVTYWHLMDGHTKSCGCFRRDLCKSKGVRNKKHGKRIREIRYCMIRRCYASRDSNYCDYGAR